MNLKYTKAQLEAIILTQLANLEAMNELVTTMRLQNELINRANVALRNDIAKFEKKEYAFSARKKAPKS